MDFRAGPAPVSGKVVTAMSRIAVFGATGIHGGLVVQRFLAQGDEVVALGALDHCRVGYPLFSGAGLIR